MDICTKFAGTPCVYCIWLAGTLLNLHNHCTIASIYIPNITYWHSAQKRKRTYWHSRDSYVLFCLIWEAWLVSQGCIGTPLEIQETYGHFILESVRTYWHSSDLHVSLPIIICDGSNYIIVVYHHIQQLNILIYWHFRNAYCVHVSSAL